MKKLITPSIIVLLLTGAGWLVNYINENSYSRGKSDCIIENQKEREEILTDLVITKSELDLCKSGLLQER